MLIDTRTIDSMIASLASYLDVSEDELFRHIDYAKDKAQSDSGSFIVDVFGKELLSNFPDLQSKEKIDEIYVYHLTRRLNDSFEDKSSDNLKSLLLKKSPISLFLSQYKIGFIERDGHPILVFNGNEVSLDDTSIIDVCYLRSRLGYNEGREDYCFNGFAFRDRLMKNTYTMQLYNCPEFIDVLSHYLPIDGLKEQYCELSKYYCFTYKMKMDEVIFDGEGNLDNREKEEYLLMQIAMRIMSYLTEKGKWQYDGDNPIIRIADDKSVSASKIVNIEEITFDMIK